MADAEERFLKSRLEREAARVGKGKDEAAEEMSKARAAFHEEVKQIENQIQKLIEEKKLDEATERCRVLQQLITSANEMLTLPSHEQRSLNTLLSSTSSKISEAKTSQKGPAKKFGFSSKAKLVLTSSATVGSESLISTGSATTDENNSVLAREESSSGVVFADLTNQTIFVPIAKAVFVRRCSGCTVYALPTAGSLFLSDCAGCVVYCAPHQLRVKSCDNMSLYTWCTSRPVIESCREMRFGGYTAWRGLLKSAMPPLPSSIPSSVSATDTDCAENRFISSHEDWVTTVGEFKDLAWAKSSYTQVDDFHWLKQSQSPNWCVIPEEEWKFSDDAFITSTPTTATQQ